MIKPKYHVGDILYRKDTQKKATIEQIVKYVFGPSENPHLCYVISEPLNHGQFIVSDLYLRVDYIDSDDNFCDFKGFNVPKYKVGDLLVYTDEESHQTFSLIQFPRRRNKEHTIVYIDNNDDIRLATEKEKHKWINEQGEFHTGEEIIYNGVEYRIAGKHILIENGKAEVCYSVNMEYNDNFTIPIKDGDKEFRRKYYQPFMEVPNYTDPLTTPTKDTYINQKAMEIFIMTYIQCLKMGDDVDVDLKHINNIASKAVYNFKKMFQ